MTTGGPATTLFSGATVLCMEPDGSVDGGDHGLFFRDTRVLSRYRLTVAGQVPQLVRASQPESDRWIGVFRIPRDGGRPEGPQLPQDALEIIRRCEVGPGFVETIEIHNRSALACRTQLRIELDSDFADVAELRGDRRQRGTTRREVTADGVTLTYRVAVGDRSDERGLRISGEASAGTGHDGDGDAARPVLADFEGDAVAFEADLAARGSFAATVRFAVFDRGSWLDRSPEAADHRNRQRSAWRERRPRITCTERLRGPFERAADDLFDLRSWELEEELLHRADGSRWVLNAGVPMFTGLFGRDVITSGWQSAMLGPRALAGALDAVAGTQTADDDPWRDAEPGKLIHEQRSGPLATLGLTPRDAYYGSQTTPASSPRRSG